MKTRAVGWTILSLVVGAACLFAGCGKEESGKTSQAKQSFPSLDKKYLSPGPAPVPPSANPFLESAGNPPKVALTLEGHTDASIYDLALTFDGLHAISAGYGDYTIRLWDTKNGALLDTQKLDNRPNSIAILPESETVVVADVYRNLTTWAIEGDHLVSKGSKKIDAVANGSFRIAASPNGSLLAAACFDKKLLLLETQNLTIVREIPTPEELCAAAFSPDGKLVATSGKGNQFTIWDLTTGQTNSYTVSKVDPSSFCYRLAFSPDGTMLATAHNESTISIWSVADRKELHNWFVRDASTMAVAFSPDSKALATAQSGKGIYFWEASSKREIFSLPADVGATASILFSPDGTRLISCGNETAIRIWSR